MVTYLLISIPVTITGLLLVYLGSLFFRVATGAAKVQHGRVRPGFVESPEWLLVATSLAFALVGLGLVGAAWGLIPVAPSLLMPAGLFLFGIVLFGGYARLDQRKITLAKRLRPGGRQRALGVLGLVLILLALAAVWISPGIPTLPAIQIPPIGHNFINMIPTALTSLVGILTLHFQKNRPRWAKPILPLLYLGWAVWAVFALVKGWILMP